MDSFWHFSKSEQLDCSLTFLDFASLRKVIVVITLEGVISSSISFVWICISRYRGVVVFEPYDYPFGIRVYMISTTCTCYNLHLWGYFSVLPRLTVRTCGSFSVSKFLLISTFLYLYIMLHFSVWLLSSYFHTVFSWRDSEGCYRSDILMK